MATGKPARNKAEDEERRARRAAAQTLFDGLSDEFVLKTDVNRALMFGSTGLRRGDKFFAFVGRAGDLVLKLPEEQAAALVASGEATAVKAGRNPTREWVSVPLGAGGDTTRWRELIGEAYQY